MTKLISILAGSAIGTVIGILAGMALVAFIRWGMNGFRSRWDDWGDLG